MLNWIRRWWCGNRRARVAPLAETIPDSWLPRRLRRDVDVG